MAIKYVFTEPVAIKGGKKANPQKIGEELAKITERNGGELKPREVVEAARNTRSAMHKLFEWDNEKAADAYRLDQARAIISVIRVDDGDNTPPVRAYLSVKDGKTSYRAIGEIRASEHLQSIVLKAADRDLAAWQERYRELTDICDDVMSARQKIKARQSQYEARA